jgi:hypothetical protein
MRLLPRHADEADDNFMIDGESRRGRRGSDGTGWVK